MRKLLEALHPNLTLTDPEITEADIPWMAENCMTSAGVANDPVVFTEAEIAEIYRNAL